jgi:hypothetical protein
MDLEVDKNSYVPNNDDMMYGLFKNVKPSFILLLIIVVVVYIIIFSIIGRSGEGNRSIFFLELILWITLIVVLYINVQNSDKNIYDFKATLQNLFNDKMAKMDVKAEKEVTEEKENEEKSCKSEEEDTHDKEVFHLPNNKYSYKEAHDACKMFNARLATYDEVEKAYQNGGNWCSYGWSEDQLALFPTQKSVYNELKKIKGHENDCGRPGINGGFMANPHLKFGVNCFGKKPTMNDQSEQYMHSINHTPAIKEDEQTDLIKEINDMIIAPFNKEKWSEL